MAKNHVRAGATITCVAPSGGVISGNLYIIGALIVIASVTVAEGEEFEGHTKECWTLPKVAADVVTVGAKAYYDAATGEVTVAADNGADTNFTPIGHFVSAAGNGDTEADVRLVQGMPEDGAY